MQIPRLGKIKKRCTRNIRQCSSIILWVFGTGVDQEFEEVHPEGVKVPIVQVRVKRREDLWHLINLVRVRQTLSIQLLTDILSHHVRPIKSVFHCGGLLLRGCSDRASSLGKSASLYSIVVEKYAFIVIRARSSGDECEANHSTKLAFARDSATHLKSI